MNEKAIREMLEKIQGELSEVDERREALLLAHKGLESLLRLNLVARNGSAPGPTLFDLAGRRTKPKGKVSLRSSVLKVIRDARGQPLHSGEILRRALTLGAKTEAKDPNAIIDLTLHSLKKESGHPIEKTAPRTWRWTAP